jgi:hypothetical protein
MLHAFQATDMRALPAGARIGERAGWARKRLKMVTPMLCMHDVMCCVYSTLSLNCARRALAMMQTPVAWTGLRKMRHGIAV